MTTSLPPAVAGVYFRTDDHTLIALNPRNGTRRWTVSLPNSPHDLVATDRIIYTYDNKGIVAIRANDGARLWNRATQGKFAVANGIVYTFMNNGTTGATASLSALDGLTGIPHWTSRAVDVGTIFPMGSAVIVVRNAVTSTYAPAQSTLDVLDATTGSLRWKVKFDGVGIGDPVAHGSALYVPLRTTSTSGVSNVVQAYRFADGASLWKTGNIPYYLRLVAADNDRVYVETQTEMLALRVTDGGKAWDFPVESLGQAILVGGVLYAPHFFGNNLPPGLIAIDSTSGKQRWMQQFTSNPLNAPPVVSSGIVYMPTAVFGAAGAGRMYALKAASGSQIWSYQDSMGYPIVTNGTLYTFDISGSTVNVYAFNATTGSVRWKYKAGHHLETNVEVAG